ncbi:MAG: 4-hydroxythreonine-4-phosphate dehydrogenase PdxA [Rhodobiaceae bacterium]|nr:4-hydroxythreonine-4-phosphate dehydrogenase PdxA [Rhodobiaceae bacterium]|tara:strand:+ start:1263 stop:2261 length:999 start_codon:yes stop_codon:yes gene_type:complete
MPLNKELPIAISMGEPGGINIEIILKCIKKKLPDFFLIADPDWAAKSIKSLNSLTKINIIENIDNCSKGHLNILPIKNKVKFGFKKSYNKNVPAIIESLNISIKLAKQRKVAGIVTLPVMKKTLIINGFNYPGHTEYLGKVSNKRPLMIMLNKKLKVATLTTHIPISQVPKKITKSNLEKTIEVYIKSLKLDFGLTDPKVAVSSLNPHSGEEGTIGNEEIKIIKPTIDKFKKQGNKISGPKSADTMFHKEALKNIDANLCMFHDQALIPIKSSDFYGSINFTAGLPFIRTSPDHGTAFDIAGENKANSSSLTNAIKYVNLIYNKRIKNEKKL